MGWGKTTLGRLLSEAWSCPFVDLDAEIERQAARGIRDLMQTEGEPAFREHELRALQGLMPRVGTRLVVATGGGVVETPDARGLLQRFDHIVWLRADPQVCIARLGSKRTARPLLDSASEWRRRWEVRLPWYEDLAQIVVDTDTRSVSQSLAALLRQLDAPDDSRL